MEGKPKIHSQKNIFKMTIWSLVIICIVFVSASYLINSEFRNFVDTKILRKEISENTANMIEINVDSDPYIHTYGKYITVLSKNVLNVYNQDARNVEKIDVNITSPCTAANNKYFVLAENQGKKLYCIADLGVKWEKDLEGKIYRVSVNKNGYVSVILTNSLYPSVVVIFNNEGEELFRTYVSNNYAICSEISDNNKYLAIGQIDYSGTIVKSIVELISIDSVKEKSQNSRLYKYESESSKILNNIKFNSKNEAICLFDSYIQKITELSDERLYDIKNEDIFVDINLGDNFVVVEKESSGLFSYQYQMNIKSTTGKSDKLYILESDIPKILKVTKNDICFKLVGEVRIINSSGWLVKRYTTNSEIKDIVLGENIVGIVYHNKIEVINL